jgi:hypothetical protein
MFGTTGQLGEKDNDVESTPEERTAGAEAHAENEAFAARLKSCPVTKHSRIDSGMSFSPSCEVVSCYKATESIRCLFLLEVRADVFVPSAPDP